MISRYFKRPQNGLEKTIERLEKKMNIFKLIFQIIILKIKLLFRRS
jgi:hypothetical protein